MKILYNKKEWQEYKLNCSSDPERYPVLAWKEWQDFGLMGDGKVSYFTYIPKNIAMEAWVKGFAAGKGQTYEG